MGYVYKKLVWTLKLWTGSKGRPASENSGPKFQTLVRGENLGVVSGAALRAELFSSRTWHSEVLSCRHSFSAIILRCGATFLLIVCPRVSTCAHIVRCPCCLLFIFKEPPKASQKPSVPR